MLSILCFAFEARGQTVTGTVLGHVADLERSTVAGASVILHSVERNFERRTNTNTDGEFNFQLVPPGKFILTAERPGFASATVPVEVVVATPVRADVILGLQSLQQTVTVVGEDGVSVQTENANLGVTVSPREMSELPSLTRSPYDFIALMAGLWARYPDLREVIFQHQSAQESRIARRYYTARRSFQIASLL